MMLGQEATLRLSFNPFCNHLQPKIVGQRKGRGTDRR
ncbi:MAG: hypothetical protein QG572_1515, partial [Pseudomonadota bacterium]|nr:hypothetical protein [Pseudomonadota bacterium]